MATQDVKSFRDLECWKACRELKLYVYALLKHFPEAERYGCIADLRKTLRSVTQNIAEGYGRFSFQENARFCQISRGSLYEVLDLLIDCTDLKYLSDEEYREAEKLFERAVQLLNGYINYLNKKAKEI